MSARVSIVQLSVVRLSVFVSLSVRDATARPTFNVCSSLAYAWPPRLARSSSGGIVIR